MSENDNLNLISSGTKFDQGKPRMDLISSKALVQLARVLGVGAAKYQPNNWRGGIAYSRLIGAMLRHIAAFNDGEDVDPESGISHIAHAMCNCMFLLEQLQTRPDLDDRYKGEIK